MLEIEMLMFYVFANTKQHGHLIGVAHDKYRSIFHLPLKSGLVDQP